MDNTNKKGNQTDYKELHDNTTVVFCRHPDCFCLAAIRELLCSAWMDDESHVQVEHKRGNVGELIKGSYM